MRRILLAAWAASALALGTGGMAFAADDGYHPGGNSCDAGHGAFGAFSHHTGTWIPVDAREDGGLGHSTGPVNSAASAACQALK